MSDDFTIRIVPPCVPEYKPDLKCNCNPSCPDSCGGYGLCSGGCPGATPPCACGGTNADGTAQNCCSGNVCGSGRWCTSASKCCLVGEVWNSKLNACRGYEPCDPVTPPENIGPVDRCTSSEVCCPGITQTGPSTFESDCGLKSKYIATY